MYYKNGLRHRANGPAVEWSTPLPKTQAKEWWVDGKQYTQEQYDSEAILDIRSKTASLRIKNAVD